MSYSNLLSLLLVLWLSAVVHAVGSACAGLGAVFLNRCRRSSLSCRIFSALQVVGGVHGCCIV